jgi:hypothetical protein
MLFLLIACAAAVYLWHHAPALLLLIGGIGVLWYVVIPLSILLFCVLGLSLMWSADGLRWLAAMLPNWRIFNAPAPKPAPLYVLTQRADLVAIPALLGVAGLVIWLCSLAPR